MTKKLIAALCLSCLPGLAQATVYDCTVNKGATNLGWITERYQFEYAPDQGSMKIIDEVIYTFNKEQPVDAVVSSASDAKIMFRWSVFAMDSAQNRFKLDFRGVLYLANSEFSVQANPVGYANKFNARGTCSVAG